MSSGRRKLVTVAVAVALGVLGSTAYQASATLGVAVTVVTVIVLPFVFVPWGVEGVWIWDAWRNRKRKGD